MLAQKFGLDTVQRDGSNWLAIPYIERGKTVNHKYRLTSEKRMMMDAGAPLTLWNVDCLSAQEVVSNGAEVIITEGEMDALAAITAGLQFVVSVPNGAPSEITNEPENAKRYEWVHRHLDQLDRVKTFVLATDGDQSGRALAADLAALLGPERCKFVTYPEGCKDLNDVAMHESHAAVVEVVNSAKPYPVKGLYQIDDFPERGPVTTYPIGIKPLEGRLSVVPGTLTVVTGFANMGKTTLVDGMVANMLSLNIPVCRADFETFVKPIMQNDLRRTMLKCASQDLAHMDTTEVDEIIRDNLSIIAQNVDEDSEMDLTEFLGLCRTAVIRHGVKVIVLDPWNELEHKMRAGEPETVYTSRALKAIKRFAQTYNVAFWIVVHPAKPDRSQSKDRAPGLYDCSGSAHWANKADYGLTYHRPKPDENLAYIIVNKVRKGLPGKKGSVKVTYDWRTSEFQELDDDNFTDGEFVDVKANAA